MQIDSGATCKVYRVGELHLANRANRPKGGRRVHCRKMTGEEGKARGIMHSWPTLCGKKGPSRAGLRAIRDFESFSGPMVSPPDAKASSVLGGRGRRKLITYTGAGARGRFLQGELTPANFCPRTRPRAAGGSPAGRTFSSCPEAAASAPV